MHESRRTRSFQAGGGVIGNKKQRIDIAEAQRCDAPWPVRGHRKGSGGRLLDSFYLILQERGATDDFIWEVTVMCNKF